MVTPPKHKREKMRQLIAQGSVGNLSTLANYEGQFKEGERGRVVLRLRAPVPQGVIDAISYGLRHAGVALDGTITQVTGHSAELTIPFRKGIAPLAIIAVVVIGFILVRLTFWKLFKELGIDPFVGIGLLILIGIAVVIWLVATDRMPTIRTPMLGVGE